ncbi:uncharacterized protein EI97DRAFT_66523 [Westerdykella ornata]|uniref:Fungal N-terminal domain-containing protein n=1 Tax=Westerdykella ornata TaxID=318751 RepID=A0A6A6JG73_WESOR|nr:uncharacterized protein EI97DRAFT_66523 [Westerdykella ornata]KAF2275640.1 hypothetical protein EI97DRAFT_66523 [Westerdykella ornata]
MDPFTIALGATQFVGLAGQLVESVVSLRRKLVNIKNAPKLIRRIHEELRILQHVGARVAQIENVIPDDEKPTFVRICDDLGEHIYELYKTLTKVELQEGDRGAKRFWHSFLADGKRPQLEEELCVLQRTNTALAAFLDSVIIRIASATHDHLTAHTAVVTPAIERIETHLSAISETSENIFTQTVEIRKDLQERSATIISHIDHAVQSIGADIPKLIKGSLQQCLEEYRGQFTAVAGKDTFLVGGCDTQKKNTRMVRSLGRKHTVMKRFPLPIGFIQTKVARSGVGEDAGLLYIEISLIPFKWLSSQGRVMRMDKTMTDLYATSWDLCLRSYNIVRDDAMILRACRARDLPAIQKLFQYGQASPFDVDCDGRALLSYVWNSRLVHEDFGAEEACQVQQTIQFLITQGADPTTYVQEFLESYRSWTGFLWAYGCYFLDGDPDSGTAATLKSLDDTLRMCLENSRTDPFEDGEGLLSLWKASLGGYSLPALDSSYLFREDLAGLDELVFENPDQVFYDIVGGLRVMNSNKVYQEYLDQNYDTLVYLCRGGPQSIKSKVFSRDMDRNGPLLDSRWTCFCPVGSSHLLFQALHERRLAPYFKQAKARIIRKHVHRVLVQLLSSGEDPRARCDCKTSWQSPSGFRSATDLAGEEGLLDVWERALQECGHDATEIVDEWRYEPLPDLLQIAQDDTSDMAHVQSQMAPTPAARMKLVGTALYHTFSSIV